MGRITATLRMLPTIFSRGCPCFYDLLYKNECQNWRNKINKAKKTPGFPVDRLEDMLAAFESFKKEALQRKQAVKKKETSPKDFSGWLLRQSNIIVELAETEN